MPIDASVFDKIRNYSDYAQAQQDFEMRKAAAAQQLQTGGIDAASKANIYKTQLLSGAAAGGQEAYDKARTTLQTQGIDTSEFAPDVGTAGQQLQAARLAQSPLGTLMNTGLKMDSNNIALAGLTGQLPGGSAVPALLSNQMPGIAAANPRTITPAQARALPAKGIMPNGQPDNVVIPAGASAPPAPANLDTLVNSAAPPAPAMAPTPKFTPPFKDPGETLAAYNARVQQAFEAYKSDPGTMIAQENAKETGKVDAQNMIAAKKAQELTDRLRKNLEAMRTLNPDVPSGGIIPASAKAYLSQAGAANGIGKGTGAIAADQWDQINNQQIISEIQQFVASGGANTRINQTLDRMIRAASGIDKNALPSSREAQIKNALAEIENKNVSAGNIAGGNAPYQDIPVQTSAPKPGMTQQGTDGTYMFNGGDPSVQSNWKKVK